MATWTLATAAVARCALRLLFLLHLLPYLLDCAWEVWRLPGACHPCLPCAMPHPLRLLCHAVQFCADVEPGDSRVKDCLEDNMDEDDFSKVNFVLYSCANS